MHNKTGRFHLYSDTSKFATGSALYQIQNGKPKLIAYASKRLPEATQKLLYNRSRAYIDFSFCWYILNSVRISEQNIGFA